MFPMRWSTIFKSRWMALLWAAGIIWFACDVAGSAPQSDNSAGSSEQAIAEAQNLGSALNSF
jgi:hypothetical protein